MKIAYFCCFSSNYVYLSCLWLLKPHRPQHRYSNHIPKGLRGFIGVVRGKNPPNCVSPDIYMVEIDKITGRLSCFDQSPNIPSQTMKPNPSRSTHGTLGVGLQHRGVILRSWQGDLGVTARSQQLKMVANSFCCCFYPNYIHLCCIRCLRWWNHLDHNTDVPGTSNTSQKKTGVGGVIPHQITFMVALSVAGSLSGFDQSSALPLHLWCPTHVALLVRKVMVIWFWVGLHSDLAQPK